jgi:hypothetical protein
VGGRARGRPRGGRDARPRRGARPLRRGARGARAGRRGAGAGAPRDAARARRRDVRRRRHRGGPPPLRAGRGGARRDGDAERWPEAALGLLAGAAVRRGRYRGLALLTQALDRLPRGTAAARPADGPARRSSSPTRSAARR